MSKINVEMHFCRRCGSKLHGDSGVAYKCEQGHPVYLIASPAVGLIICNDKDEVLILERAIDPGKGLYDVPGGFCDGPESLEEAIVRETDEEAGLLASDYSSPRFIWSFIDRYDFGGETLPVLGVMFVAKMTSEKQPVAGDDAATAKWVPLAELDLAKICFPSVRGGLEKVIAGL